MLKAMMNSMITPGTTVFFKKLSSRPELNGTQGTVQHKDEKAERWIVQTQQTNEMLSISAVNLAMTLDTMAWYTPIAGHGATHPREVDLGRCVLQIKCGMKVRVPPLFAPFLKEKKDAGVNALRLSPFGMLTEDLLLSVLIRVPRADHRAISSTCKRFRLLVRGKRFLGSRRKCPTTGFSCKEQLIALVGGGGVSGESPDQVILAADAISVLSPGALWSQGAKLHLDHPILARKENIIHAVVPLDLVLGTTVSTFPILLVLTNYEGSCRCPR